VRRMTSTEMAGSFAQLSCNRNLRCTSASEGKKLFSFYFKLS
jgi:hypothetical protein